MKEIKITRGLVALVDDEDFDWLSEFKWYSSSRRGIPSYAATRIEGTAVLMHRLILHVSKGQFVDHINRNGFDNQRSNLRLCTGSMNLANMGKHRKGSSCYKGVHWHPIQRLWSSSVCRDYHRKHLGWFHDEKEAAKAYDKAATEFFGEFARTNKMLGLL